MVKMFKWDLMVSTLSAATELFGRSFQSEMILSEICVEVTQCGWWDIKIQELVDWT